MIRCFILATAILFLCLTQMTVSAETLLLFDNQAGGASGIDDGIASDTGPFVFLILRTSPQTISSLAIRGRSVN